jgi:predicted dehydrogenase
MRKRGIIAAVSSLELMGIADILPSKRSVALAAVPFFDDVETMLHACEAEVLCVCTPNFLHEPHTIAGLHAGLHTVVEKPMARSIEECDRMIATAAETGKTIFAVKQNRYNPPVRAVKELIEAGALGQVYFIQVCCFWNRSDAYYAESPWRGKLREDGGLLFTQFSHFVDILYYLNGPIVSAQGSLHNYAHTHNTEVEDAGAFVMQAANGATISFSMTTAAFERNMEGSITLFGEKGTVKIGGQYLNTIEYQHLAGPAIPDVSITAKANDYGFYQGSMSNHDRVIENVVDVLRGAGTVMTSAEEGREVVRIIEQMYLGAGRRP